ncbi:MAG: hypothetical protein RBT63_08955 [Bdellovibrionales bacterium]|nr:hypothetical protein [Bdellovibrionales bacterium]
MNSYEKDCLVMPQSKKVVRMTFSGTENEMGANCSLQTAKLERQVHVAQFGLGVPTGSIRLQPPAIEYSKAIGQPVYYRCHYLMWSAKEDLRFTSRRQNTRYWINQEDQHTVCQDDARLAETQFLSIGAASSLSASLLQGQMCTSRYVVPGLDTVQDIGEGKTRIIKFGSRDATTN